jgi:apolipoprotein D and lipocalin family protein
MPVRIKTPQLIHMKTKLIATALCLCCLKSLADETPADGGARPNEQALTSVEALDVPRYMGTWYEIAKFPNWFQKKCVGSTKAEYSLKDDGKVQVINRCQLENGEMNEATGVARQVGNATSPKLEVRFAPAWLSFIPLVWGDYWVIDIDDAYQLVAVSEPKREYLWVLSRTPKIDPKAYENLLVRLAKKGFDIQKLEITRQGN